MAYKYNHAAFALFTLRKKMIYLLQVAEEEKKPSESKDYREDSAPLSNIESLTKKREEILQAKAREKVLNASAKISW